MKMILFWKPYPIDTICKSCFSQWFPSRFTIDGVTYNCCEQYMMAQKAKLFGDDKKYMEIIECENPWTMKALGRHIRPFDEQTWSEHCKSIVFDGNLTKFSQNPDLKDFLMSTGDSVIAEASPYDRIWGIGLREDDPLAQDKRTWKGRNLLGQVIMEVRDTLKNLG